MRPRVIKTALRSFGVGDFDVVIRVSRGRAPGFE